MKKSQFLFALILSAIFYTPAFAAYELVWQDNFDSFNTTAWSYETGWGDYGWGNNEQEWYTNSNKNVYTENGKLVIKAIRENTYTSQQSRCIFTSGRIKTAGKVSAKYGKVEALIKCPDAGKGVWPAFWMLGSSVNSGTGWPYCGEIDIMEQRGSIPNTTMATWHWNTGSTYNHASWGGSKDIGAALGSAYRIYGVEWTPAMLTGYVCNADGSNRIDYAWMSLENASNGLETFQKDFFVILNLAMGGNFDGDVTDGSISERSMLVDWVRIYQDKTTYPQSTLTNNSTGGGGTTPVCKTATNPVATFFYDSDFGGTSVALSEGTYTLANMTEYCLSDDAISSIKVLPGYKVTIYFDDNYNGASASFTSNSNFVGATLNDKTTSIKIEAQGVSGFSGIRKIKGENGLYLDMNGNGTANETRVVQWSDEGTEAYQQFNFTEVGNGVYSIVSVPSGRVLDIAAGSSENKAELQIYDNYSSKNQQFILVNVGNGKYQLVARHCGKVIEVPDYSTTLGQVIKLYDNNNQTCSYWTFQSLQQAVTYDYWLIYKDDISGISSYLDLRSNSMSIWDGTLADKTPASKKEGANALAYTINSAIGSWFGFGAINASVTRDFKAISNYKLHFAYNTTYTGPLSVKLGGTNGEFSVKFTDVADGKWHVAEIPMTSFVTAGLILGSSADNLIFSIVSESATQTGATIMVDDVYYVKPGISAVNTIEKSNSFSVYPNPVHKTVFVQVDKADNISIYNTLGELIYIGTVKEGTNAIDVSGLAKAMYIIKTSSSSFTMIKE